MVPKAFLSLAAEDAEFVDRVYRSLPHGQAFYYKQSFANGARMLEMMEREVASSQLFILFASQQSVTKTWVNFELDQARLARINGTQKRLQVLPADAAVAASDLPGWMQDFWMDRKARGARDVARLISHELNVLAGPPLTERMYGRGGLQDQLRRQFNLTRRNLGGTTNPNIILASGVHQIGRETFLKHTLPLLFPSMPYVGKGPVLDLPVWADIEDLYRSVRELVEDPFSLAQYESDLTIFRSLDERQKVDELTQSLRHFADLGESVIVRAPSFLYDRAGRLQNWVRAWFNSVAKMPTLVMAIVTNRQIPSEDLGTVPNVCQLPVGSLENDDIKLIIDEMAAALHLPSQNPSTDLLVQIGGHPALARAYVRLAEQYGAGVFERSPSKLFAIQDGILQDNLQQEQISALQQTILHVLSWVPRLDGFDLEQICIGKESERGGYNDALNDLILGCLVEAKGSSLSISGAVRAIFRRRFGYGPEPLLNRMAATLDRQMKEADAIGSVRAELVDAIIFMHVLTGKAMPDQFRRLLLPSTLETLVRDAYNSGREDEHSYDLVIKWGLMAEEMKMDESVREEILSSVVRAYIRKEEFAQAEELLDKFGRKDYRSRFFLHGFKIMKEGNPRLAIPQLERAIRERRYRRSAINQLGIAYFRTGNTGKLRNLLESSGNAVEKSAFLLDLRAQMYTAENKFNLAEKDIQLLARLPEDNGRSQKRRAIIVAKRDKDYGYAVRLVSGLIVQEKGRAMSLRFLRGVLAAGGGDHATAMSEAEYLRANARRSGEKQYLRIVARLALAEGRWRDAWERLEELGVELVPDRFLRVEALRQKSEDATVGLSERDAAKAEAVQMSGRMRSYSDLDFIADD